jgi:D-sedoheptulose 7-phosphate isomerase
MDFIESHLRETMLICEQLDREAIHSMVQHLVSLKARGGRLFLLGVGGSAANCSHATNDFRKIAHIESYCPTDNVSELTARINDEGWNGIFAGWLRGSRLSADDMLLILSVGGGNIEKGVSVNLIEAMQYAKQVGAGILGIVGRDGGYTAKVADACVIVPTVNMNSVTPHSEAFQAVVWHLLVTHPEIQKQQGKWESIA